MSILLPNLKPTIFSTIESNFGSTIAKHLYKKVMNHQLWCNRSIPVGMLISFYGSQTYADSNPIDQPDVNYWQWCDGSAITNGNSPLLGQNTPNTKERFLKGALVEGITGGQSTISLGHNHSGETGTETDNNGGGADTGSDHDSGTYHEHDIDNALGSPFSVIPPYIEVQYFMRVDGGAEFRNPVKTGSFGSFIDEELAEFGKIFSQELATSLSTNIQLLDLLIPVGTIAPVMTNIAGVPLPDDKIWQECDGSEIINENSPLRSSGGFSNFVPNLIDGYVRVPATFGLSGQNGGENDTLRFGHDHTGLTDQQFNSTGADSSNSATQAKTHHSHPVFSDLNSVVNVEPPFFTIKFYMRIQ